VDEEGVVVRLRLDFPKKFAFELVHEDDLCSLAPLQKVDLLDHVVVFHKLPGHQEKNYLGTNIPKPVLRT
jgi:hypothetical protein